MVCSAAQCVCAKKSTCSCGARPALKCNCSKAKVENVVPVAKNDCACGKRTKNACTCGMNASCDGTRDGEIDFTHMK